MWRRSTRITAAVTPPPGGAAPPDAPSRARALRRRLPRVRGAAPDAAAPSPSAAGDPPGPPADPAAALKELAALASRTAGAHTEALDGAPPELARLLASVAAASAAHAYLLAAPAEGGAS